MKTIHVIIGALFLLLFGIFITVLSFEEVSSEPPENLPEGMVPITPEVGKTLTPIGNYIIIASVLTLMGTGIYSAISFFKTKRI